MSAFLVTHKHINSLLTYANRQRFAACVRLSDGTILNLADTKDLQRAAEILLAANVSSIQARYPDTIANPENMPGKCDEIGVSIRFKFETKLPAIGIVKACDCYDYQACEFDGYYESDAAQIVGRIRKEAIANIPGYEDAAWEIH